MKTYKKPVTLVMQNTCPNCQETVRLIDEVKDNRPDLRHVEVEIIDEITHPELALPYDYWEVPTFFVDAKHAMSGGKPTYSKIEEILEKAAQLPPIV